MHGIGTLRLMDVLGARKAPRESTLTLPFPPGGKVTIRLFDPLLREGTGMKPASLKHGDSYPAISTVVRGTFTSSLT